MRFDSWKPKEAERQLIKGAHSGLIYLNITTAQALLSSVEHPLSLSKFFKLIKRL
jgi:hypothetical protein